ncbi:MAG TPA: hypothetical protein VF642_04055 [Propionibacteriaceae bacterium]
MKSLRTLALVVCLALVSGFAATGVSHAATNQKGTYFPLVASRLLDTRTSNGGHQTPLGGRAQLDLQVSGRGGVPSTGVSAVVINLTVVGAASGSFLTAWPTGQNRPPVSSINGTGQTRANIATVSLGTGGQITIYNSSGSVHVIVDVVGYYSSVDTTATSGNDYANLAPERQLDTRQSTEGQLRPQEIVDIYNDFGFEGALTQYVKAVAVNITAVNGQGTGFVTAWDGVGDPPKTSTLNFGRTVAIPNLAVVKTSLCTDPNECEQDPNSPTRISIYNGSNAAVDVLVDLVGLYFNDGTAGLRFVPLSSPQRIKDSRVPSPGAPLTARQTQVVTAPSSAAGADTVSLVTNVTAVRPSATTFLTLWAANGSPRPTTSNLNAVAGLTVANGAVVELSSSRTFNVYNAGGTTHYLVDVSGRFDVATSTMARIGAKSQTDRGVTGTHTGRRSLASR